MAEANPYAGHVMVVRRALNTDKWLAFMWDRKQRDVEGSLKTFDTYDQAMTHANVMSGWFSIPVVSRHDID